MSADEEKLVLAGDQAETQSVQEVDGPQGEGEEEATPVPSVGNTTVEPTQEDTDKVAEDGDWKRESGTSSGSSTPSVTTYDVGSYDELQEITVEIAEQDTKIRQDNIFVEGAEMQGEPGVDKEEQQDREAAEKLKQSSEDTDADVQTREIVVEMDTFNRSSTRRESFMMAMQNDETVGAENVPVAGGDTNGNSGGGVNGASGQEKADADDSADDQHAGNIAGSSQGFQIMEIFTDDDFDTVRDKWRRRLQCSARGKWLCCVCVMGVMAAVLTAVLVPVSLVFVEYHEIALARSKLTGRVDRSQTIYPGCHLLFPDTELIRFQATAHLLRVDAHISSSEGLAFRLQLALQYLIKPEELGELHKKYAEKYEGVIESVINSEVRNRAVHLSLDQYRRDRVYVQQYLHRHLADRLQGNCCPLCCPRHCPASQLYVGHNCSTCSEKPDCDSGFHVTLLPQHLQVLTLQLPSELTERYLVLALLQVEMEKELFVQESKVEQKRTEKLMKDIHNKGREVLGAAEAQARQVSLEAEAEAEKTRQQAYTQAMGRLFSTLNITSTQRRLSLMNTLALRDFSENFSLQHFDYLTVV